ncbi:hypothetical protein IFR05_007825 [Cadophora sp. M221]|nr:hypothetical protein IFR05_007825 [Cadophora sp. M221]
MRFPHDFGLFVVLLPGLSCTKLHFPRATGSLNATTTRYSETAIPTCCYLGSFNVGQILWYSSSVKVTVATVSIIVYQYDNTAVTSYKTVKANSSQSLPTGVFRGDESTVTSGVPTSIIGHDVGGYDRITTLTYGTEYTDPYGVVYTSPTPVWEYSGVSYFTSSATMTGSNYASPEAGICFSGNYLRIYPPGYYFADDDPMYGRNGTGELFQNIMPTQIRDWMVTHVPPNTDTVYSSLAQCTMGFGDGIPIAHVPVNELTAAVETTTTMAGNLGGSSTTSKSVVQTTAKAPQTVVLPTSPSVSTTPPAIYQTPTPTSKTPQVIEPPPTLDAKTTSTHPFNPNTTRPNITPTSGTEYDEPLFSPLTTPYNAPSPTLSPMTPVLVIGSSTLTLNSDSAYVFGTQTLTPGEVVTASGGAILSLEAGGASVVVLGGVSTSTQGLGDVINSIGGFAGTGTGSSGASPSGPIQITSSGARVERCGIFEGLLVGVLVTVVMM